MRGQGAGRQVGKGQGGRGAGGGQDARDPSGGMLEFGCRTLILAGWLVAWAEWVTMRGYEQFSACAAGPGGWDGVARPGVWGFGGDDGGDCF